MKKFLLSFILFFCTVNTLFAQRDTEHWFAPYYDVSFSTYNNALYLSTDSVTPFVVTIYNGTTSTVVGTSTISKNNPQVFTVPVDLIRASLLTDAFTNITKGLYVRGDNLFLLP